MEYLSQVRVLDTDYKLLDEEAARINHTHSASDVTDLQEKLDAKADGGHAHEISDVNGLQDSLDGKASKSHTHAIADVTGLQTALNGKAASSHTHTIAQVTNLQATLDGKQAKGDYAAKSHTHAISDVTDLQSTLDSKLPKAFGKNGGSWVSGMTQANSPVQWTTTGVRDGTRYDPIMCGKDSAGNVWNFGWSAIGGIGFIGFKAGRTDDGTDGMAVFDPATGVFTSKKGFAGSLYGNASSATEVNGHTVNADVPSGAKFTDTTYGAATTSAAGLMSAVDKSKLNGIAAGAQVNSVTGVKGNSETSYRTGNVNITKANVGLGSVANLDQSKAIKSITRRGTTFTATALDGSKTTFTQQDNNTTYGVATQSANGLMSASDKKKLDGITSSGITASVSNGVLTLG